MCGCVQRRQQCCKLFFEWDHSVVVFILGTRDAGASVGHPAAIAAPRRHALVGGGEGRESEGQVVVARVARGIVLARNN